MAPRANLLFQEVGVIEPEAGKLGKGNDPKSGQTLRIRCEVATSQTLELRTQVIQPNCQGSADLFLADSWRLGWDGLRVNFQR